MTPADAVHEAEKRRTHTSGKAPLGRIGAKKGLHVGYPPIAGYRHLEWNSKDGSPVGELTVNGPLIGVTWDI